MSTPRRRSEASASSRSTTRSASQTTRASRGRHQRRHLALVTGATSGIGLAVARDLSRDHDLVLLARSQADLTELATVLSEENDTKVRTLAVDLTDDAALAQAATELDAQSLDVLVHCAGVEHAGPIAQADPARWRQVLDLNLVSVAHLTSLLLPALHAARGLVVMMNSGAGLHTWPEQALYCASKQGLTALAEALREEERGSVRVTTIYPGRVDTPMQRRIQKSKGARYRAKDHMAATSVAAAVRLAVDTALDASIEDLSIRPAGML